MNTEIEPSVCRNCGARLEGAYCAACGQKVEPLTPTLGQLLHELTHELLNVDGKIFRSMRLLLTRPGFLTREYIAGRRVRYVSPLRLYLFFSVVFFALTQLVPGGGLKVEVTSGSGSAAQVIDEQRTEEALAAANAAVGVWVPRAMFLLVPVFAALVMLLRRKARPNHYPPHLWFALHIHAALFLVFGVVALARLVPVPQVGGVVFWLTLLYTAWYLWFAYRGVYGATLLGALWRALVVAITYFLVVAAVVLAAALPPVLEIANRAR
jgi:peptidoglycan/LPS O-acetylase OafA/YrhL